MIGKWNDWNGKTLEKWLSSSRGVQWSSHFLWDHWPAEWKGCNSSLFRHRQAHSQNWNW